MADDKTALEAVTEAAEGATDDSSSSPSPAPPQDDVTPTTPEREAAPLTSDPEPGPIPVDRHKAILEHTREKSQAEVQSLREELERVRASYQWAEAIDRQAYERDQAIIRSLDQDPIGFYQRFGRELEAHPHLGPQLQSSRPQPRPTPSLRSEDGKSAYTAEEAQALLDHAVGEVRSSMAAELQQLKQTMDQMESELQSRQRREQAAEFSRQVVTELEALPKFKDHKADIVKAFQAIPREDLVRDGVKASAYKAYLTVFHKTIAPTEQRSSKTEVVESLKKKAAAATVDPSRSAASSTKRPRSRKELQQFLEEAAR